jgi:transposase
MLVQAAQAVGHTRDNYLAAQFHRLAARRGKKRAAVAVAHSILSIVYPLIRRDTTYVDLGPAYFDQPNTQSVQDQLVKRLERLGLKGTLEPAP